MDKLKFALIGAGTWGNTHAEISSSRHLSEMVAVCNVSNESAAEIAKKYSVERVLPIMRRCLTAWNAMQLLPFIKREDNT